MSKKYISVRGAKEHNLKAIDIDIPRDKLVIITGLSGSGKSSLAFDTIYAEGQRKYVESLSAYARQFLDQLQKPDIESIEGLPPTIAIEQRGSSHNPRSTVATTTEIYDYLRLLMARAGQPRCWHQEKNGDICGEPITAQSATQIVDQITSLPDNARIMILSPIINGKKGHHKEVLEGLVKQGFIRARINGDVADLRKQGSDDEVKLARYKKHDIHAVIDRIVIKSEELKNEESELRTRIVDSVELALKLSKGLLIATVNDPKNKESWTDHLYSENYACSTHPQCSLEDLEPRLFSFNSPHGACRKCSGLGIILEFDEDLVVPNPTLSIAEGAINAWRTSGQRMSIYYSRFLKKFCKAYSVDREKPFKDLSSTVQRILIHGSKPADVKTYGSKFEGVLPNLQKRWDNTDSEYVKKHLHNYLSETPCQNCAGSRLRDEALNVFLEAKIPDPKNKRKKNDLQVNISDIVSMTIEHADELFASLKLNKEQKVIAEPILKEVRARLGFMMSVGLGYLNLSRNTGSLSGGEAQRIRLATQVGSGLVGCCYVLDEPTIGLHQRDNERLNHTLRSLCDIGNTVIVVEHDEDTIRSADHLIDIGPGPGRHGGQVVAQGTVQEVIKQGKSLTAHYLSGKKQIATPKPKDRRKLNHKTPLIVTKAAQNNLKSIDAQFPLGGIVCVTGVSGSGKSTLVNQILLKAARRELLGSKDKPGKFGTIKNVDEIDRIIQVDQSPIGRTSRSNPATYTSIFDDIRTLYTQTKQAKIRGYKPGRFSFNVKGGRCESCQGQGTKKIEMHFLPDVFVECEECDGRRYNRETLEILYKGKSIADILEMTIEKAVEFFDSHPKIKAMSQALADVGLGYIQLGQSSTTLSGGEAQRVKLASELGKRSTGHTLYVLDEPTTGLHFADIDKLLKVLARLADNGNSVLVIEHNLDVIKTADWIIDLGPEGGDKGGLITATGTPEDVAKVKGSYTGQYLKPMLKKK